MQVTRRMILEQLWQDERVTVDDLAGQLDLSPMTIRHHLTILERDGLVVSQRQGRTGAVGRPRLAYSLTSRGAETFPSNSTQFASLLLTQIEETLGATVVEELLRELSARVAGQVIITQGTTEQKLDQIVAFLNNSGYVAKWRSEGTRTSRLDSGYILEIRYCPYRWLVRRHQLDICNFDEAVLTQMTGARLERLGAGAANPAAEENSCVFRLSWPIEQANQIQRA